jgi:hypothetical protein
MKNERVPHSGDGTFNYGTMDFLLKPVPLAKVREPKDSAKLIELSPSRERWPSGLRRTLGKRV